MQKIKINLKKLHEIMNKFPELSRNVHVKTDTGQLTKVNRVVTKPSKECVELDFGGFKRKVASTHRFMNENNHSVFARDAQSVKLSSGDMLPVISKKNIGVHDVFDIMIDAPHWYVDQYEVIHHNTGKTTFLIDQSAHWLTEGKNVMYFTMEIAEQVLRERLDVSLMQVTFDQLLKLEKTQYLNRVSKIRKATLGELKIKEFPSGTTHVGHFRHVLNEFKMKQGFIPDVIFVDYLTIMASNRIIANSNSNTYYKSVAEELRNLAKEFDVPVWTAAQFNRGGQTSTDVDLTDMGESIGIAATADFMIAFMQPEELASQNQIIGKVLKNRYANKSHIRKFIMGADNDLQKFFDVDPNTQKNVMDAEELAVFNKQASAAVSSGKKFNDWKLK